MRSVISKMRLSKSHPKLPSIERGEPCLDAAQTFGALYNPHEGQVNPFKLIWSFVHRARQQGLQLRLHSPVEDFIVYNGRVQGVVTPQGRLKSKATLAIAPTAQGNPLLGEAAAVVDSFSFHTDPAALQAISRPAQRFIPAIKSAQILRTWAAPVAFTADNRPFLGPVADLDGLLLAVAFKSTVIITPLIGQVITQLVTDGRSDLDIRPFLLSRVNPSL